MPDPTPASADTLSLRRSATRIANRTALRWALLYLAASTLWIVGTSALLDRLALAAPLRERVEVGKGLSFVMLTAVGLFLVVRQAATRLAVRRQQIREQHRRALQSESRWRHLMSNLAEVAWFASPDGRTLHYVSPAALGVYGRAPDEFMRDPDLWLRLVHPDDWAAVSASAASLLIEGSRSIEYRIRHADGGWRWLRDRASVLRNERGEVVGIGGVAEDVTERRAADVAREAQRSAEAANRAKSEFLSRMSHELRTPLNAVLGFTQLLESSAEPLNEHQLAQLAQIRSAGWHLLALINDVLDVSRIEAGALQVHLEALDAREPVADALRLSEALAAQYGVRLEGPDATGGGWHVRADATRLRQVLLNLLSNAIKYNRPGGRVTLSLTSAGSRLHLEVEDNGLGMTPEQLHSLYEPFNRLGRERGGIEGTGIGLTITRELVLLMGGELAVESHAGQGTRVRVSLPQAGAAGERRSDAQPLPAPAPAAPVQHRDPRGVVLYVEDNPVNMLVIEQLLARWPKVQLVHAVDGASGVELAVRLQPDLVLLDMRLPDIDGFDVMRRLRTDERTQSLRVVALSASAMPDEIALAREAGALEYWTKPLDFSGFLDDMARLLAAPGERSGANA
ncbi:ATP-binding protein [Caldimonas sp. KR1-144]|uniref:hybrid sensor histidine kinase/response regulator n=1 Tax=Caldimonas sp. KR1-144 TaxID=3400911 RepID=UPI003C10B0E2